MTFRWDDLRLNQVEESASSCPDACGADVVSLVVEVRRLLRWMIRTHYALAEQGETELEVWTMRRLEAAMEGKDADDWRERIGEVK